MSERWHWRNLRDFGFSLHFWPLTWRWGFKQEADIYGGQWIANVGPLALIFHANIGNASSENRFEAWRGLSEAEAYERVNREPSP